MHTVDVNPTLIPCQPTTGKSYHGTSSQHPTRLSLGVRQRLHLHHQNHLLAEVATTRAILSAMTITAIVVVDVSTLYHAHHKSLTHAHVHVPMNASNRHYITQRYILRCSGVTFSKSSGSAGGTYWNMSKSGRNSRACSDSWQIFSA